MMSETLVETNKAVTKLNKIPSLIILRMSCFQLIITCHIKNQENSNLNEKSQSIEVNNSMCDRYGMTIEMPSYNISTSNYEWSKLIKNKISPQRNIKKTARKEKLINIKSITRQCSNSNNKESTMMYLKIEWRGQRKISELKD